MTMPTSDGNQTTRSVAENTPAGRTVGDPVKADPKDGDVLTYTLRDTDDGTADGHSASFDIDRATGQIMTKGALNADPDDGDGHGHLHRRGQGHGPGGRAPDGCSRMMDEANSDETTVTITVTDVNEGPAFSGGDPEMLTAAESTVGTTPGAITITGTNANANAYAASDPDTDDSDAAVTWSLSGADRSKFDISDNDGDLTFKTGSLPNYEMPGDADMDNVYEVTVVATAGGTGRSMAGTRDVKVMVE